MTEAFDWKNEVPVWTVLRFDQMKQALTAGGRRPVSIRMTGWKATPEGGKLSYELSNHQNEIQFYKP